MGQWRAAVDLPAHPGGVRAARRIVVALLDLWDLSELSDDAELVVSELVTNAYRHAGGRGPFQLEVIGRSDGVWIALADGSAIRPKVEELSRDRLTGRGMALVTALAADWGAEDRHGGKRVWVDLVHQPS
jgi:anti-sigma regulatory factor (Ser/Thr protein kinase)